MNKLTVAALTMILAGSAAIADDRHGPPRAPQQQPPDPLVSALYSIIDNLAAIDSSRSAYVDPEVRAARRREAAATISTAAAIGSALGAMINKEDRGKGAAIGAAVGGIAGLIFERIQSKKEAARMEGPPPPLPPDDEPEMQPPAPEFKQRPQSQQQQQPIPPATPEKKIF